MILDLRDRDDYEKGHIRGAVSYPAPMLSRAVNPFIPEILEYSNKEPDRIIVVYDANERLASPAGNQFFEKGVDNVFVLTGGLRALVEEFPEVIDGEIPRPPSPTGSHLSTARSRAASSAYRGVGGGAARQTPRFGSQMSAFSASPSTKSSAGAWR